MRKVVLVLFLILVSAAVSLHPILAQSDTAPAGCIENFDAGVDYFPDKVTIDYASHLAIDYFNHYKVVTVSSPWVGAADVFSYVLVQCGAPIPEGFSMEQIVQIPVQRVVSLSTTYLPHLVALDRLDTLIGVDSYLYVNTQAVNNRIEAGLIAETGGSSSVNVEVMLDIEPDLVLTYGSGSPEYDAHPILIDAGIPVVLSADWTETTPLGRAEWIKFTAAFFNAEAEAENAFDAIVDEYQALVSLAESAQEKPLVLWGAYSAWGEAWYIPGGDSYAAQLLRDAGAIQVLGDDPAVAGQIGSVPFSFEVVYEAGLDADIWFANVFAVDTIGALIAENERYGDLAAVESGFVYNNDGRRNANGATDYFETGVTNPQLILADLIAILHPELLPDHELAFFRQMPR
jgi:iron complex transport system substrate-binding protein